MAGIYDVNAQELVEKTAQELKNIPEIAPPEWSVFIKTGAHKQRPPVQLDWWYFRSAAILRSVAKLGPIGTQKLRTKFGGKKNRGVAPEHHFKGSGSVIRTALQQLETAGLIVKANKSGHKGRILTGKGESLMMKVAKTMGAGTNARKASEPKPAKVKKAKDGTKPAGHSKKEAGAAPAADEPVATE